MTRDAEPNRRIIGGLLHNRRGVYYMARARARRAACVLVLLTRSLGTGAARLSEKSRKNSGHRGARKRPVHNALRVVEHVERVPVPTVPGIVGLLHPLSIFS